MSIEIKRLRSGQMGALRQFLEVAYPKDERKHDADYLNWFFRQNPNINVDDLPHWVATDDGKIVGQLATILVRLKVAGTAVQAIWILEFILLESYRGQGLGKKLVRAAEQDYPTMITLGINEASTRVFDSLGWKPLGSIHRYHKMLFAGNAAGKLSDMRLLREGLNLLSFPFRSVPGPRSSTNKYEVSHALPLVEEIDEFWERASPQWPAAVRRDHQFLAWQFLQQPGKKFSFISLRERRKLVGYAILFFRKGVAGAPAPKAAISDLVYDSRNQDDVIDALLTSALELAIDRRAGSLVTDVLDARIEAHLKKFGFWRIKNAPRFMASSTDFQEILYEPGNWYLTRADSDVSIFEEPNVVEV